MLYNTQQTDQRIVGVTVGVNAMVGIDVDSGNRLLDKRRSDKRRSDLGCRDIVM